MRLLSVYRPPFVTETNEARWDDCAPSSLLMLVAAWTLGEATDRPSGAIMGQPALKRLREHMRDHLSASKQSGGLTVADAITMAAMQWPELPKLHPFTSTWADFWEHLTVDDCAAALWGNPSEVNKPASPLRRWTANDDFGHVIYVGRAKDDKAWIMDPLGSGAYRGQWVSQAQLRQFAYLDDGHLRSCIMAPIGGQSAAMRENARMTRRLHAIRADYTDQIAQLHERLKPIDEAAAAAREEALGEAAAAIAALRD